jgi:hypothetical protein
VLTFRVLVALGESEINDVDVILSTFSASDQEVVWLDVAMNNTLFVDLLNSLNLPGKLRLKFSGLPFELRCEGQS